MSDLAIDVTGLKMAYGQNQAVKGIDLQVPVGQIFALLGPNGAGKTTATEILEGYRKRTAGEVAVLGFDPAHNAREFKQRIGIVLQSTGTDPFLTVSETIEMYRGYYPNPLSLDDVIEVVGLVEKRDERVRKLSGGQQRRLDVAVALAGNPELLFLDEPTTGFDPNARRNAWDMIANLRSLGKTVFLTTHYMEEAQVLADEVAVIAEGLIVARGTPDNLGGRDTATAVVKFRLDSGMLPEALAQQVTFADGMAEFHAEDPGPFLRELTTWAVDAGVPLDSLTVARPTLEDVYLSLTGGPAAGESGEAA